MKTLVMGAGGQIGLRLVELMVSAGMQTRAMARKPHQLKQLESLGAESVEGDLEGRFEHGLEGCQALVFTAGSGGGTGGGKTLTVDLWGALRTIRACESIGLKRFIMISSRGADDPEKGPAFLKPYLIAKHVADDYLRRSSLDYMILQPGRLLDGPGTGLVRTTRPEDREQVITRDDTAKAALLCLQNPGLTGKTIELYQGSTPLVKALGLKA